jgi:glycosyltransferase involved in cell wall biosynthesis
MISKELKKLKIIQYNYSKTKTNTEVLSLLETSDIILMPSRCEGMSMFAIESLYKGKPMIFTSKNGLQDYLYDNINGYNIAEYDYTELANAIIKYHNNPKKLEEHSRNNLISAKNITNKTLACLDVLFKD